MARRHLHSLTARIAVLIFAALAALTTSFSLCSSAPEPALEIPAARDLRGAQLTHTRQTGTAAHAQDASAAEPQKNLTRVSCLRPQPVVGGGWSRPKRRHWTRADRRRTVKIAELVAREMGVDRTTRALVMRWAYRESNATPHEIGLMPEDVKAASNAGSQRRVAEMGRVWGPEWTYGRGLYGMQPSLFIGRWTLDASLDALCDPIVATVLAVWKAREQRYKCVKRGHPGTLLTSNRVWGTGHCTPRAKDAVSRAWWRSRGRDIDAPSNWGRRWRERDTSPADVLAHMREKVHAAGLDSSQDSA